MSGVDWIVLSANAVGIAVVLLATLQANPNTTGFAQITDHNAPQNTLEIASLN